jgi:hypothetical protein
MLLCSVWLEPGIRLILGLLPNEYSSTWENGEQWKEAGVNFLCYKWDDVRPKWRGFVWRGRACGNVMSRYELRLRAEMSPRLASQCTALQAVRSRVWFPIVAGTFHWLNPPGRTVALGSTHPPTEMSTEGISCRVKTAGACGRQPSTFMYQLFRNSGNLNLLGPKGAVLDCIGIDLSSLSLSVIS